MNKRMILLALCMGVLKLNASEVNSTKPNSTDKSEKAAVGTTYEKYRFGMYGEIMANFMDYGLNRFGTPKGNTKVNRNSISIPRVTFAFDYKITPKWVISSEVEFEAGGTGTTYEIEKNIGSENGEYETEIERGGEVALEQLHISRLITRGFNVRVGHMVLPIGVANVYHEPIHYFTTNRNEGESTLVPTTWHETGLSIFGEWGKGYGSFEYEAMVVAGLNANGFDMYNWVQGGKQGFFETDNFTSPGYVGRLVYKGLKDLSLGASVYYCNDATANSDKPQFYASIDRVPVTIFSVDAKYRNKYFTAMLNMLTGSIKNSAAVTAANKHLSSKSPYSRQGPVAQRTLTYGGEIGLSLKNCFGWRMKQDFLPFAHYEYYNPQFKGEPTQVMDPRCEVSRWQVGLNWKALPNLIVKADYATRQIGTQRVFGKGAFNSENEFALAVTYTGWFFSK